jgi:hypothetical protein
MLFWPSGCRLVGKTSLDCFAQASKPSDQRNVPRQVYLLCTILDVLDRSDKIQPLSRAVRGLLHAPHCIYTEAKASNMSSGSVPAAFSHLANVTRPSGTSSGALSRSCVFSQVAAKHRPNCLCRSLPVIPQTVEVLIIISSLPTTHALCT